MSEKYFFSDNIDGCRQSGCVGDFSFPFCQHFSQEVRNRNNFPSEFKRLEFCLVFPNSFWGTLCWLEMLLKFFISVLQEKQVKTVYKNDAITYLINNNKICILLVHAYFVCMVNSYLNYFFNPFGQ